MVPSTSLTAEEERWLENYRLALAQQFPGLVQRLVIYGSKARGDAGPEADLDILIVVREGDWRLKEAVRLPGYDLSIGTDVVPSIMVYTSSEWERLRAHGSPFLENVEREGIPAL